MKVIFLDNDGVMCLRSEWGGREKKMMKWFHKNPNEPKFINNPNIPAHIKMDNFNRGAVDVLNSIIRETDAEIVISSDWKLHCSLQQLRYMFIQYGVIKSPIDKTPNYKSDVFIGLGKSRVEEIKMWLNDNKNVTHWVAIDDLNLSELSNFVWTKRSNEGIKQTGIKDKIIKFLKDE
jgi:hypothetical protein